MQIKNVGIVVVLVCLGMQMKGHTIENNSSSPIKVKICVRGGDDDCKTFDIAGGASINIPYLYDYPKSRALVMSVSLISPSKKIIYSESSADCKTLVSNLKFNIKQNIIGMLVADKPQILNPGDSWVESYCQ